MFEVVLDQRWHKAVASYPCHRSIREIFSFHFSFICLPISHVRFILCCLSSMLNAPARASSICTVAGLSAAERLQNSRLVCNCRAGTPSSFCTFQCCIYMFSIEYDHVIWRIFTYSNIVMLNVNLSVSSRCADESGQICKFFTLCVGGWKKSTVLIFALMLLNIFSLGSCSAGYWARLSSQGLLKKPSQRSNL